MTIRAKSFDGMIHQFPDGTPDDVIDRVMMDYTQSKQPPPDPNAGQRPLGLEPDTYAMPVNSQREVAGALAKGAEQGGDVAPSFASGLVRGTTSTLGMPVDFGDWIGRKRDQYITNPILRAIGQKELDANAPGPLTPYLGSTALQRAAEDYVTGPMHQPTTISGQYAERIGEFAPGAAVGPVAGMGGRVVKYGVIPAIASESAGRLTAGTPLETPARVIAGLGAGIGSSIATAPNAAERAITRATRGTTPQQVDLAEQLIRDASARGINLSRAEALNAVTNGATDIGSLQRYVEGAGGMRDFYANRPQQVQAAAGQMLNDVAPEQHFRGGIGPAVGQAAEQEIRSTQTQINAAARPLYQAAEPVQVGPQVHQALTGDPIYAATLQDIRNNPRLNATVANMPDDSVAVIDLVQRRMREQAENARVPGQAASSNLEAMNLENARTPAIAAAETATGSRAATTGAPASITPQPPNANGTATINGVRYWADRGRPIAPMDAPAVSGTPAVVGTYEAARATEANLRQNYLDPLMNGPLGKVMGRPETDAAINAVFPARPTNSAHEVTVAMSALARRNGPAATDLLRAHMQSTFDEANRLLQSGAPQYAGAGFVKALVGNPQQLDNLRAGFTAVRGAQAWEGVQRYLDIMAATGQRQRPGSMTTFNTQIEQGLSQGNLLGEAGKIAATGGIKLPARVNDAMNRWSVGRNVDELSRLLTDPAAAAQFRRLATAGTQKERMFLVGQLTNIGMRGSDAPSRNEITVTPRPRP